MEDVYRSNPGGSRSVGLHKRQYCLAPSNAPPAVRNKWKNGEIKTKKIIRDSIDKRLVAYISDLDTSKEIYDRLVSLFKVNDANQVLFLINKLKEIKKGKDESMQSYFLRITEINNDP